MKKRILWLGLSFLLVAALVLASCAEAVPGEQEEEEEEEEPQHGGTLTWFTASQQPWMPQSWDQDDLFWETSLYTQHLDNLLQMDILERGPRGTNEYDFSGGYIPEQYLTGNLAESWEVAADAITFHIRPGIMWHKAPIMESRELTAQDVAYSLNRRVEAWRTKGPARVAFIDEITATDEYTVVVETNKYDANWSFAIAYSRYNAIQPPELTDAGAADWKNHVDVGTGAWLLENYVTDSEATYVPNPDWWNKKQIINGKEYDTPFVDTFVLPFIGDWSMLVAALRTAKIDWMSDLHIRYEDTLRETCPDLNIRRVQRILVLSLVLRCDTPPFDDVDVRRAITIGTDRQAVTNAVYGGGIVHAWPFGPALGDLYTPVEELPPEDQLLFDYNPTLAKQMLADADWPDGFEVDLIYRSGFQVAADTAELLEAMWADLGVTLNLVGLEEAAYVGLTFYPGEYKHAAMGGATGNVNPYEALQLLGETSNNWWNDEYFNTQLALALSEIDTGKRNAILKDLAVYAVHNAVSIPLGSPPVLHFWWPWLKNYYGEDWTGDYNSNYTPLTSTLWIDQDLKETLGY